MAEPQLELQPLGRCILSTFVALADAPWDDGKNSDLPSKSRISTQYQRFILWARSLGMNQVGHASLDYRVRDAPVVKASLAELLGELKEHLENLASIILGDRLPLEQDASSHQTGAAYSSDDGLSDDESSLSSLGSIGSFKEVEFRLESIVKRLDSLYELASRIRSPRTRLQRPVKDLYKHLPEKDRTGYIEAQKQIEISRVAYVQQQKLQQDFTDEQLCELGLSKDQLLTGYGSANNWLIQRTGIANSRRRQQIAYWKKHAEILGRDMAEMQLPITTDEQNKRVTQVHASENVGKKLYDPNSIATSATRVNSDAPGLGDTQSVISTHSRVSTVIGPKGEILTWPSPPKKLVETKYFSCPYCCVLCPEAYLVPDKWR
ncbi:ankyrin repeat protein [Ilyonectria robusta]